MNSEANLTENQFKTAATVLSLMVLAQDGEVSEFAARTAGARLDALRALVAKGLLVRRVGPFVMPTGPLAGQTVNTHTFYSVAE